MKNLNTIKATALGVAMVFGASVLTMNGCKNPAEDIKVAISTSTLSKSATLIRFVKANATAGAALPAQITVTISGPGKDFVQTDDGKKVFIASEGVLPISLSRLANPTPASPIVFTVSANVTGYAPVSKQISISSATEVNNITVPLLSFANPAEGTAVVQVDKPMTGGVVVAATKIETAASTTTPQSVDLTLAANTQVQDANKQPIAATSLKTTVVYYGTNDVDALKSAATFLTAVNPVGPNNQAITGEVSFVTAGAVSINMTAGSSDVKNFSKPISAEIEINPALINPKTGMAVKAGDVIPVWSLDEKTGQWKHEGSTTVNSVGGKLVAIISITHLSTWALNWYNETAAGTCNTTFNITLGADLSTYVGYQVMVLSTSGQPMLDVTSDISTASGATGRAFSFTTATSLLPGKVVVYAKKGDLTPVTSVDITGCAATTIPVPAPAFTDYIATELSVEGNCTNKKSIIYPTSTLVLNDVTDGSTTDLKMTNGKVSVMLKNNHTYNISAIYNNKTYKSENVKVDRTSTINVTNASSGLVVTGKYDGTKLPLKAVMPVKDCS